MHDLKKVNKAGQLLCCLFILLCYTSTTSAQSVSSYGSWNILGIKAPIKDKWTLDYNHIFLRNNDYYKDHNRMFSDLSLSYKLGSGIGLMLLQRYVTVSGEDNDAYWIFADVSHTWKQKDGAFSIKSRLRAHIGTEWVGEFQQSDFLRAAVFFNLTLPSKFTPFASIEPFYQFNDLNQLNRIRYELGTKWKLLPRLNLSAYYRIEDFMNNDSRLIAHFIVVGLVYKI